MRVSQSPTRISAAGPRAGDAAAYARQHRRLWTATVVMVLVFVAGTAGYWWMGEGRYSLVDCIYMTAITLTTVGFNETIPVTGHPDRELFTMALLFAGVGTILYFASAVAAFIIEGDLADFVRRRRMERRIERLSHHMVVCGAGRSGALVASELVRRGHHVVVVDIDPSPLEELASCAHSDRLYLLEGDATDDRVLERAGVARAAGLVAALSDDRDNLYVTFTARQTNPRLRIVSKAQGDPRKLQRAGATAVVALNEIGGHRMVSELLRPSVTNFIHELLLDRGHLSIEEFVVSPTSRVVGQTLLTARLREHANVLVAAARPAGATDFVYNPGPDLEFAPGMVLIVLGPRDDVDRLRPVVCGRGDGDA